MKWKQICCLTLTAITLAGCGASIVSEPDGPPDGIPRGRFVETEITPPGLLEAGTADPEQLFVNRDGSIHYFVSGEDGGQASLLHYLSHDSGNTWERVDTGWYNRLADQYGLRGGFDGCMDDSGCIYMLLPDPMESRMDLLRIDDSGTVSEIQTGDFGSPVFDEALSDMPEQFQKLRDGSFLICTEQRLLHCSEEGEILHRLEDFPRDPFGGALYLPESFVTAIRDSLDGSVLLTSYDYRGNKLADGPSIGELWDPEQVLDGMTGHCYELLAGEDDVYFLVSKAGISRSFSGGSCWETLLEGPQYRFGSAEVDVSLIGVEPGSTSFYMALRDIQADEAGQCRTRLYRYAFEPKAPAGPETRLTVFAMEKTDTLAQAVFGFQMENSGCKVEIKLPPAENELPPEEVARILERELLEGNGPDVILMDGLPLEKYRKAGVLADLSGLLNGDGYFTNLVSAFETNGKIDAVPARVIVPAMTGKKELLEALQIPPDLMKRVKKGPLDGELLMDLLARTKAAYDSYGGSRDQKLPDPTELFSPAAYYQGKEILGIQDCGALGGLMDWSDAGYRETAEGNPVYPEIRLASLLGSGVYVPTNIVAVNAGGERYYAEKFVEALLSEPVQTVEPASGREEGFPVNRAAFHNEVQRLARYGCTFSGDPAALMEALDMPAPDYPQMRRLLQELPGFLGGLETAQEAVERILAAESG